MKKTIALFIATLVIAGCDVKKEEVVLDKTAVIENEKNITEAVMEDEKVENITDFVTITSKYKPGVHYTTLKEPLESKEDELVKYIWYKCGHCYSFEKMLQNNYQDVVKAGVTIRTEHAAISSNWVNDAQLFYTLRDMNLEQKSTALLMDFFHNNEDGLKTFEGVLAEIGTSEEEINENFTKKSVIEALEKSYKDSIQAGISGTPSIIVEGKYLMIGKAFKSTKELLDAAIELALINKVNPDVDSQNDEKPEVK